jgi:S1-C subfamily serine protease
MLVLGIAGAIWDTWVARPTVTPQDTVAMIVEFDFMGQWVSEGTGFFIDNKTLLTAGHVATIHDPLNLGQNTFRVFYKNTKTNVTDVYEVESAHALKTHDIGIIRIEGTYPGPVAPLGSIKDCAVGDPVLLCGYMLSLSPMGLDLTTTWGHVSDLCLYNQRPGDISDKGDALLDITIYPGGSGGPIWHNGKVVAIVSRGIPGLLIVEPVDYR